MDEQMHSSAQTKMDEFIASLAEHEDDDISDRDLIPIRFKTSSRLQQDMYSPMDSRPTSKPVSRNGSCSTSRRASVSKIRRDSVVSQSSARNIPPASVNQVNVQTINFTVPEDKEQSHKLFAAGISANYRIGKTPYTSAAVTPAVSLTPEEFEGYEYFDHDDTFDSRMDTDNPDYFGVNQYSLSESLYGKAEHWNPLDALSKLKVHSENMVLSQSLHEALVKEQEKQEKQEQQQLKEQRSFIAKAAHKRYGFKSSWDDEEYELPSALASGQSSPSTPVFRDRPTTDLSREIELEKERYKQQRASLMLAKPQTAIASTLEAELDLSQGTIFKKRYLDLHYEKDKTEEKLFSGSTSTLSIATSNTNQENEEDRVDQPLESYYNDYIVQESKRRLAMLLEGRETEVSEDHIFLPNTLRIAEEQNPIQFDLYELNKLQKPFFLNMKSYRSNFGFDKNNKVRIYQINLFDDEEDLDSHIPKRNDYVIQKSPLDKPGTQESIKETTRKPFDSIVKLKDEHTEELSCCQEIEGFEVDVISVESESETEEEADTVQEIGRHGIEYLTVEISDEEVETITIEVSDDDLEIVIIEAPSDVTVDDVSIESATESGADIYVVQTVKESETEAFTVLDNSDVISIEVSLGGKLDTVCAEVDQDEQDIKDNEIDIDVVDITKDEKMLEFESEEYITTGYFDVKTMPISSFETSEH